MLCKCYVKFIYIFELIAFQKLIKAEVDHVHKFATQVLFPHETPISFVDKGIRLHFCVNDIKFYQHIKETLKQLNTIHLNHSTICSYVCLINTTTSERSCYMKIKGRHK